MATVSIKDVVSYYNSVIKSFMDQGYVISPTTMHGGYINVNGYTDLVKLTGKKSILRIFLTNEYVLTNDSYYYMIRVIVREYELNDELSCMNLFYDEGKLLSEKRFYQIKENRVYTETLDELKQIREIQCKRRAYNREEVYPKKSYKINKLSADFIDSIMERINRLHGLKHATASCIKDVRSYIYEGSQGYTKFKGEVIFKFNNRSGRISLG